MAHPVLAARCTRRRGAPPRTPHSSCGSPPRRPPCPGQSRRGDAGVGCLRRTCGGREGGEAGVGQHPDRTPPIRPAGADRVEVDRRSGRAVSTFADRAAYPSICRRGRGWAVGDVFGQDAAV